MRPALETLYPAHDKPRLIEAARLRSSCRSFCAPPDTAQYAALSYAVQRYALPGVRIELLPVPSTFFTSTLLGMKRITGCTMMAAVIIDDTPLSRLHAGIVGESLALEATSLGLGSCWATGSFRRRELRVPVAPHEGVLCVIALGQPAEPLTVPASRPRKALDRICRGDLRTWPEMLLDAAELVRIAPSAMNMQPWMMSIGPENEFILDANDRAQLDAGIALCHAELALDVPHTWYFGRDKQQPIAWATAK